MTYLMTHIEPLISLLSRLYLVMSEVITITSILWSLNLLSSLVEKTYNFGYVCGKFYRNHLHDILKSLIIKSFIFTVLLVQLSIEGGKYLYDNREMILSKLNNFRNQVGDLFVLPNYNIQTV